MSKNSAPSYSNTQPKNTSKSNANLRSSYTKLTLDLAKFEYKPIAPMATTTSLHTHSPANATLEKASFMPQKTKSPRANQNLLGLSTETLDMKETYTIDKKVHPHTTKAVRNSYQVSNVDKPKKISNSNEKFSPVKSKEVKTNIPTHQAFLTKKQTQDHEGVRTSAILSRQDVKPKVMEEPPKKFSMPNSLGVNLNGIYTTGSNSHRGQRDLSASTQQNINSRPFVYVPLNRRSSQKSSIEEEHSDQVQIEQIETGFNNRPAQIQRQYNNFLTDFSSAPKEYMKKAAPQLHVDSIADSNTEEATNDYIKSDFGKVASPKTANVQNDLIRRSKDSNLIIQDNGKSKSNLSDLTGEIQNFKKMKALLKEKDKTIQTLQTSLTEAVRESEDLKKELQKDCLQLQEGNPQSSQYEIKRTKVSPSASDMDGINTLLTQLKAVTDGSEEIYNTFEQKNSLLEAITKKNQQPKSKKQEASYALFGLPEKVSQTVDQVSNNAELYQRNFSGTLEDTSGKRLHGSPYYDASKKPKLIEKSVGPSKKGLNNSKRATAGDSQNKIASPAGYAMRERAPLLGTSVKAPEVATEKAKKQTKMQMNNSATGTDIDILKRKFSHEPRTTSEGLTDLFAKKHSVVEGGSTFACTTEKEPAGDHPDVKKALGDLKDRIAKILNKHKDDYKMLKMTHALYAEKLEKLIKE